ncbi:MAG: ATP-binding cassette domain-containing protein, partial [bacterium]|nr:ATP-binding cassette domain-containing protein [bacterium]
SFTGIILEMQPGANFKIGGEKPNIFKVLFENIKQAYSIIYYFSLCSLAMATLLLVLPASIRFFIDKVIVLHSDYYTMSLIWIMVFSALIVGLLCALSISVSGYTSEKIMLFFGGRFYWHMLRLPINFFSQRYAGDLGNRVLSCIELSQSVIVKIRQFILSSFIVIFFLAVLACYNLVMSILCLLVFVLNALISRYILQKSIEEKAKIVTEENKLFALVMSNLENIEELKSHGSSARFFARFLNLRAARIIIQYASIVKNAFSEAIPTFLFILSFVILFAVGTLEVINGNLSIGIMVACFALIAGILQPINTLFILFGEMNNFRVEQSRINDVKNFPLDFEFTKNKSDLNSDDEFKDFKGAVSVKDLTFSYDRFSDTPTISAFSLEAKPGDRIAIVGASGSGKSTIAKLICGLYEPEHGSISFDNVDRKKIPRSVLIKQLGYVEQNIYLFAGTVWDNLTLFNTDLSKSEVEEAARDACIFDDIQGPLDGFAGIIESNGQNISGGERQRLEIARSLILNPSIIILDECMSDLDSVVEKQIYDNFKKRKLTCIYIAHRLSTIRDCDEIIVLDNGKVVQRGSHEQLIKEKKGFYENLIAANS